MAYISNRPGIGEILGEKMTSGLSTGLQQLMNMKLQDMQRQKRMAGLQALGMPQEAADVDPRVLQQYQKGQLYKNQLEQMNNILSGISDSNIQPNMQQDALSQMQPQADILNLQQGSQPNIVTDQQLISAEVNKKDLPDNISRKDRIKAEINKLEKASLVAPPEMRQQLADMASSRRKELSELKKVSKEEEREARKETLPVYKEVVRKYKDARENDQRLGRMKELVKKGKLGSPTFNNALETLSHGVFGIGINLKNLMSADAQEFDKLSTEFLKGAKELFGARVTDNEIKMFMKMVPTLGQSDAGKMRVIANMNIGNKANKIRYNAMRDIIKENKGKRPFDLEDLIEERAGKQLDALAEEFKSNIRPLENSDESLNLIGRGQKALGTSKWFEAPKLGWPF